MDDLNNLQQDNHRFLSLTGVAMDLEQARTDLIPKIETLKAEVFDFDPDYQIHFHRTDIVKKKGVFGQLRNEEKRVRFDAGIFEILE